MRAAARIPTAANQKPASVLVGVGEKRVGYLLHGACASKERCCMEGPRSVFGSRFVRYVPWLLRACQVLYISLLACWRMQ